MSDELELTVRCPRCGRNAKHRAIAILQDRFITCAACGRVKATDDILAQVRLAQHESERKLEQLSQTCNYRVK